MLCRKCYHEIPAGSLYCPRCGCRQGEEEVPFSPHRDAKSPWEERERLGFFVALGETLQKSLFHPAEFFRHLPPAGRLGSALLYAVIVGTLSMAVAMMWQGVMPSPWERGERVFPALGGQVWYISLILIPFVITVSNLVWSGVLHLSLKLVGAARSGYGATLKAVAYSNSASAFNVFPFCGAPIGLVWYVVVQVIGLRELHRISTGRAFWAWFLPFVVFVFGCLMAIVVAALILLKKGTDLFFL